MERSANQPSRRGFQQWASGGFFAAPVVRKILKIPRKLVNVIFSSRLTVWLEHQMVGAYGSSNRFVRTTVFSVWELFYKVCLLVHTGPRFEIYRMQGVPVSQNEPVTMIYFQGGRGMAFFARQFFGENPYRQERVGSCRFFRLEQRAKEAANGADLVVVERNTLLRWTPDTGFWQRTPTWLIMAMEMDPQQPWEAAQKRMRSQYNNIRMVKKNGFTYRVSHDPEDFEFFYERMYRPYIMQRYPEIGVMDSKLHLHGIFERGFLAIIGTKEGEPIAGVVSLREGEVQFSVALGVLDADTTWLDAGALSAMYYFQIKHAHEDGLRRVDFGGVRPFLKDGLYNYKYRWSMRPTPDYWNPREWLMWIPNGSEAARRWVAEHPMVPEYLVTSEHAAPETINAAQNTADGSL